MIRRWERGTYRLCERYELLYAAALGVPPDDLRRPGDASRQPEWPQGPHAPSVIAAIGAALHADPAAQPADDHAALERDVLRAWELRQSGSMRGSAAC